MKNLYDNSIDRENYGELCEAVYFFDRISCRAGNELPRSINEEDIKSSGIDESIYRAVVRILAANGLLGYDGRGFEVTAENEERRRYILDDITGKNESARYAESFDKAISESAFFFDRISELEYEIYSRCNFQVTLETGKEVVKHIDLTGKKVLEPGGNSGGLGTAVVRRYKDCRYTVVDTRIPCMVGNEFKESGRTGIKFIEGNVFELALPGEIYDYIIVMNLLHDFDDGKCLDILYNCVKYCGRGTKFLIIEDILTGELEPKEAVMHGLRLAVECRGGRQRTVSGLEGLFLNINYRLEGAVKLDDVRTMLIMGAV